MTQTATQPTIPVLPPTGAGSANDLWDIELPAEVETANYMTHGFWSNEDGRCGNCDCRGGGQWSRFACQGTVGAQTFADFLERGPQVRKLGDLAVAIDGKTPIVWEGKTDRWSSGWVMLEAPAL